MKYIKVPRTGQYNTFFEEHIVLDKIVTWKDYYICVGEDHWIKTDWTADEILDKIKKAEEA